MREKETPSLFWVFTTSIAEHTEGFTKTKRAMPMLAIARDACIRFVLGLVLEAVAIGFLNASVPK